MKKNRSSSWTLPKMRFHDARSAIRGWMITTVIPQQRSAGRSSAVADWFCGDPLSPRAIAPV
jgi:hypothetical protein